MRSFKFKFQDEIGNDNGAEIWALSRTHFRRIKAQEMVVWNAKTGLS